MVNLSIKNKITLTLVATLSFLFLLLIFSSNYADAFSATQPDDGTRLVVNATTGAGTFPSSSSYSYIYVPVGTASSRVRIIDVANQSNGQPGRISSFTVRSIDSNGNCLAPFLAEYDPGSGGTVPNNTWLTFDSSGSTYVTTGGTYKVFCVNVQTAPGTVTYLSSCGTIINPAASMCFSNVSFRLYTDTVNARIGNFAGSDNANGTGLFNDDLTAGPTGRWSMDWLEFAPTCGSTVSEFINLYDLDTYQAITNADLRIQLERAPKGGSFSAVNIDIGASGYPAGNGSNATSFYPDNVPSGGSVNIKPIGEYDEDFKYRVRVIDIGGSNKIRVRIPFHEAEVNNSCNTIPTGTVTADCDVTEGTANAVITVNYDLNDNEGNSMTLAFTDPTGTARSYGGLNGTASSIDFTVTRRATGYSVTGISIFDGTAYASPAPADVTGINCPLPSDPDITIRNVVGARTNCENFSVRVTDNEGFDYDLVLEVFNGASWVNTGFNRNSVTATGGSGTYTYDTTFTEVRNWRDFDSHTFRVYAVNEEITVATIDDYTPNQPLGPCLRAQCSGATIPASIQVNTQFYVSVQFSTYKDYNLPDTAADESQDPLSIQASGNAETYSVNVSIAPPPAGSPANPVVSGATLNSASPSTVGHNNIGPYTAPATPQNSLLTFQIVGDSDLSIDCPDPLTTYPVIFAANPYVQFFRGDVIAGYGMRTPTGTCSTAASGIFTRTTPSLNSPVDYVGSGTQMATFALGPVIGFRSAITDTSASMNATPWFRTFANTTAPGPRNSTSPTDGNRNGGLFNSTLCAEDWFHDRPSAISSASSVDYTTVNGVYRYENGSDPVRLTGNAATTGNRKIFVDGDVIIGDGTTANQRFLYDQDWASTFEVPSVVIVASGNIYISDNVTEFDGMLVAGGTVFTCTPTTGFPLVNLPDETDLIHQTINPAAFEVGGSCYNNSLSMHGSIIANDVRLWRTGGTINKRDNGAAVEVNSTGTQGYATGLTQAETFRLPPELFIAPRFGEGSTNGEQGKKQYDSLISLPPVF